MNQTTLSWTLIQLGSLSLQDVAGSLVYLWVHLVVLFPPSRFRVRVQRLPSIMVLSMVSMQRIAPSEKAETWLVPPRHAQKNLEIPSLSVEDHALRLGLGKGPTTS